MFSSVDPRFIPFKSVSGTTYGYTFVKVFGEGESRKIKVVHHKALCSSGQKKNQIELINDCKLDNNVCRAKSVIFEYAFCNPWNWFFTGTLDPSKYARDDLNKFHKDFTKWIGNYNRLKVTDIKFLIVPELHADMQNWHFHGFLMNVPELHLHQFQIGDRMGQKIVNRVKSGHSVFDWPAYSNKFGFCDLEPIQNAEAISKYITKYINKELGKSVSEVGAHMYYHSRGLKRAKTVKEGLLQLSCPWTFENDYVSVAWLPYSDELLEFLTIDDCSNRDIHFTNYRLCGDFIG